MKTYNIITYKDGRDMAYYDLSYLSDLYYATMFTQFSLIELFWSIPKKHISLFSNQIVKKEVIL